MAPAAGQGLGLREWTEGASRNRKARGALAIMVAWPGGKWQRQQDGDRWEVCFEGSNEQSAW